MQCPVCNHNTATPDGNGGYSCSYCETKVVKVN